MLNLTVEFVEEDSDKYTAPVQRGSATHVSQHVEETILFGHRDGAVTVVLELVDHVIHNLCTRDVRENGTPCVFKGLSSSPKERGVQGPQTFNIRIQRARETKMRPSRHLSHAVFTTEETRQARGTPMNVQSMVRGTCSKFPWNMSCCLTKRHRRTKPCNCQRHAS